MPRFIFPFEVLLETRCRAEEDAQRAVAQIERQRLELEESLRRQQRNIAQDKDALRTELTGPLNMRGLRLAAHASLHLIRKAQQVVLQLAGLHQRLEAKRARLIEATRARRALELLRERRFEQWKKALNKAENAALDELSVIAFARKEVRR